MHPPEIPPEIVIIPKRVRPIAKAFTSKSLAPLWYLILKITFTKIKVTINSQRKIPPVTSNVSQAFSGSPLSLFLGHNFAIPGYNSLLSVLC